MKVNKTQFNCKQNLTLSERQALSGCVAIFIIPLQTCSSSPTIKAYSVQNWDLNSGLFEYVMHPCFFYVVFPFVTLLSQTERQTHLPICPDCRCEGCSGNRSPHCTMFTVELGGTVSHLGICSISRS